MTAADTNSVSDNASGNADTANDVIMKAVKWSAAAAVVPLPYVDLVALGAVQLNMVRDLAKLYGVEAKDETIKGTIAALLGTLGSTAISGSILGSSIKLIPGGGTLIGSAGLAATGSAATYAIGKVFVSHFENGGTVDDMDAEAKSGEMKEAVDDAKKK